MKNNKHSKKVSKTDKQHCSKTTADRIVKNSNSNDFEFLTALGMRKKSEKYWEKVFASINGLER